MSFLKWTTNVYVTSYQAGGVPTTYYELWRVGEDRTAWYNLPAASIRKLRDHMWELTFPDNGDGETRYFKTLKAAKAMGIVIVQMEK